MAQGSRGRAVVLGAGVLLCTGLAGCMDKKPISPPPLAKGTGPTMPGAKANNPVQPVGAFVAPQGSGVQQAGGFPPVGNPNFTNPTPASFGGTGVPTTPGARGPGTPMPTPSNYTPAVIPAGLPGYQTPGSNVQGAVIPADPPAGLVAARAQTPSAYQAVSHRESPPVPALIPEGPLPPPAPTRYEAAPAVGPAAGDAITAIPTPLVPDQPPPNTPPHQTK